ncbi:GNAT family N-acetyltransferase [Flavobacterium sp.]|uniref:GNAT family N-acetyltransferase n=1 Tax=Flavobacterium sp. TaxID=239 RepID=UPI004047B4EE
MRKYKCLTNNIFQSYDFHIEPIRDEDKYAILDIRNSQLYHLRQAEPLTKEKQEHYFSTVISALFEVEKPNQLLFSFFENNEFIGYGGLVHINWIDKNAEISFVMKTELEKKHFSKYWSNYLNLLEKVAFKEVKFHKIFTYAFDLRPHLYETLESCGFKQEARLKEHCFFENRFIDVLYHSKIVGKEYKLTLVTIEDAKLLFDWVNEETVRKNSINTNEILWENHFSWLKNKLNSNSKLYLLREKDTNICLGQIRLDLFDNYWEIDYSIDKNFRGRGLGKTIVELIQQELIIGSQLKAIVKNDNLASQKIFKTLGFVEQEVLESQMKCFIKIVN